MKQLSLEELWASAPEEADGFSPACLSALPAAARRYLTHAIAPGTPMASAVRLRMHGTIKLGGWHPFTAEQVTVWKRGMIWAASASMKGLPVSGWDRVIDGVGAMRWKMLGLFPVMKAEGPDVTRSAIGRMQGEVVWLPSVLCADEVRWEDVDSSHTLARFSLMGADAEVKIRLNERGGLQTVDMARWGNPEGKDHHVAPFGVVVEDERTFAGYTVPSRIRAGWYFGTDRFAGEGEFFRATVDEARYR